MQKYKKRKKIQKFGVDSPEKLISKYTEDIAEIKDLIHTKK